MSSSVRASLLFKVVTRSYSNLNINLKSVAIYKLDYFYLSTYVIMPHGKKTAVFGQDICNTSVLTQA